MEYTFVQFLKEIREQGTDTIYQGMIGKIESFDGKKMRADVTLQLQTETDSGDLVDFGKIAEVPVGFIFGGGGYYIRPYYKKDDLVWVTFSSRAIRDALNGDLLPESKDKNDLSFAMVSHGLTPENFTAPTSFDNNGLLIGKDDAFISIIDDVFKIENASGDIELKSSGQVAINGTNLTVDA
jgi:hypothetical protein